MRKILALGGVIALLCVIAVAAPANAAERSSGGIHNGSAAAQTEFSARSRHYRHRYYARRYYGPRYYGGPYYGYPYGYAYSPGYYPYRHYYRRPGVYFGFGF